jgi:hypothetical protein
MTPLHAAVILARYRARQLIRRQIRDEGHFYHRTLPASVLTRLADVCSVRNLLDGKYCNRDLLSKWSRIRRMGFESHCGTCEYWGPGRSKGGPAKSRPKTRSRRYAAIAFCWSSSSAIPASV